jgi:hypothetical protein
MKDPNTPIVLNMSTGALRELVCEAWSDSAVITADRLIKLIEKRVEVVANVSSEEEFYVGSWNVILNEDGRGVERETQVVFNAAGEIIAATVKRDHKQRDATPADLTDIADSMRTNDVFEDPEEWDFELAELPTWAADQIADKRKGWA